MPRFVAAAALAAACLAPAAHAQIALTDDLALELSGSFQPRFSVGVQNIEAADRSDERLGFGIRRARLQMVLTYRERLGIEYDVDGAPGDVRSVDLYGFYNLADHVQLRAGRLPMAQPRAFNPTSNSRIDAVDRAVVGERWAAGTTGTSGRDIGADLEADLGRTLLRFSVHNGTGGFSRELDNYREGPASGSYTRGADRLTLAAGAAVHHEAGSGVSFGAFAGLNGNGGEDTVVETAAGDEVTRGYTTAAAHLYWGERPGSQPLRLKLDAVGLRYDAVDGARQESAGVAALAAARVLRFGEAFARGEQYWDDIDADPARYGTFGVSYSLSAAQGRDYRYTRVTAAYTIRRDEARDLGHLFVIQGQFVF